MELTYKIETAADVAKLEELYDANIRAINSLKSAGDLTAAQDAKLRELQRTVSEIADTFRRFNETLANPPTEYLEFLEKVKLADFASMNVRGDFAQPAAAGATDAAPPAAESENVRAAKLRIEALDLEARETREMYEEEAKLAEANGKAAQAATLRAESEKQVAAILEKRKDAVRELTEAEGGTTAAVRTTAAVAAGPQGATGTIYSGAGLATAPPTEQQQPTIVSEQEKPEFDIVTQEQYDLLVKAKQAAEEYLKTLSDDKSIEETKAKIASMNDSLERSEPQAQKSAAAYLRMSEALDQLNSAAKPAREDAGENIKTLDQLRATERLLEVEKQRLAQTKEGTEAHATSKAKIEDLTAAINGNNAGLVRSLELLRQEADALKRAGDAAGLAANARNQQAVKNAIGAPGGLFDGVKEKGEELFRAYRQGGGGVEGFIGVLRSGGATIAAWAAGLGLLGLAAKRAADEFEQAQVAATKLDAAMAQQGLLTDANREKYHALASQLEATTAVADEKWLTVMARLVQFGADTRNMDKYTDAVKNLAGIMGGDVESAATAVSRAMQGHFGMFSRYGIYVDDAGTKTEKLEKLFEKLAQRGGGQLEALGNTVSGQKSKLSNALSNFWENIGNAAGPSIWRGELAKSVEMINSLFSKSIPVVDGLSNSLAVLSPDAQRAADAIKDLSSADVGDLGAVKKRADEATAALGHEISALRRLQSELDQQGDEELKTKLASIDLEEARARPTTAAGRDAFERQRRTARRESELKKLERAEGTTAIERDLVETALKKARDDVASFQSRTERELAVIAADRDRALTGAGLQAGATKDEQAALLENLKDREQAAKEKVEATLRVVSRAAGPGAQPVLTKERTEATPQAEAELGTIRKRILELSRLAATEAALEKGRKESADFQNSVLMPALTSAEQKMRETEAAERRAAEKRKQFGLTSRTEDIQTQRRIAEALAEKRAEDAIVAAKQKRADVEKTLSDERLSPARKAALQHDLRQAAFDERFATLQKQRLAVRDDPAKAALAATEARNFVEAQRKMNADQRLGKPLKLPSLDAIQVVPEPDAVDAKRRADSVAARELEARRRAADSEARRRREAESRIQESTGPQAGAGTPAGPAGTEQAERVVATTTGRQVAAIDRLGDAVVRAMATTTRRIEVQSEIIETLRQQMSDREI